MRASLAVLGLALAASAASAQVRPDSAAAARDTTAGPPVESRAVEVALPTGGGVFYYRAGSRVRRARPSVFRTRPARALPGADSSDARALALGERDPQDRPREVRSSGEEGLTQRDLDRLESRLLNALDRRLDRQDRRLGPQDRRADAPAAVRQRPAERGGEAALAPVAGAPPRPDLAQEADRPAAPPDRAQPISAPDAADRAVADEVEQSILDTGLFRAASVHFETARAGLLPVSEQTLRAVGSVLVRHPGLQIEVGGHTDAVGSEADNERLSQARAESVVAFLVAAGVARERLAAVGYGERRPVASGATETGRALNRRVEFVVVDR